MGNCQAAEVATVVIQHPGGRVERLYWPTSAADVMKSNPGYHVALVTLYVSETKTDGGGGAGTVRFTRVRLLKPRDMLLLGQVYRLITSQEVAKALRQRKYEKLKKNQAESIRKQQQQQQQQQHGTNDQCTDPAREETEEDSDATHQATNQERDRQKSRTQVAARGRHWRPSLQSISEAGS